MDLLLDRDTLLYMTIPITLWARQAVLSCAHILIQQHSKPNREMYYTYIFKIYMFLNLSSIVIITKRILAVLL